MPFLTPNPLKIRSFWLSFFCCNHLLSVKSFSIQSDSFEQKKVEYARCPHCGKSFYKEIRIDFKGYTSNTSTKMGKEAEFLIQKAFLNRLDFFTNTGSKGNQNWFYGDFKKSTQRDEKGNLLEFQIKRNFNGVEVANLGISKVIYK